MPLVVVPGLLARIAGSKLVKYVIAGVTVYVAGDDVVAYVNEAAGETVADLERQLEEEGGIAGIVEGAASAIGGISLAFIEGLGGAVVKGLDNAYDTIREKLRGNEANVIAGMNIAFLGIITVTFLFNSARAAGDAV